MNHLSINPSLIVQGTLTFVTAIACSDAIKEITMAIRPESVWRTAALKCSIALIMLILVVIVVYHFPPNHTEKVVDGNPPINRYENGSVYMS